MDDGGEGAPRWLQDQEQQAWRGTVAMVELLYAALDRQLQADAGISHAYYLILAMLSEAPGRSLRMSRLAERTHQSQSRLSHAVSRLQERGWVERRPCPSDRRGLVAVLTDAGMQALVAAAPGHVQEVRRRLFDQLEPGEVAALARITQRVVARLGDD